MVSNRLDLELQALHVVGAEGDELVMRFILDPISQLLVDRLNIHVLLALGFTADVAVKIV